MFINSRFVAFILGLSIASVTTAFLSLVQNVSGNGLLVAFLLAFSSSYLLINITLEFLIFREVNNIYNILNKLKNNDLSFLRSQKPAEANIKSQGNGRPSNGKGLTGFINNFKYKAGLVKEKSNGQPVHTENTEEPALAETKKESLKNLQDFELHATSKGTSLSKKANTNTADKVNDEKEYHDEYYDNNIAVSGNPLKRIKEEIFSYAYNKQKEIDDLKRLEAFRREFVANVSHELKTPIFAAQGFVHTLLDGAAEDKKVRYKFLKKAGKSLDGLDLLVQDLLTLSKMETGDITMQYEAFNMGNLVEDAFEQVEDQAEKKSITLKLLSEPAFYPILYGDPHRIYQVMINLIGNAIKYTKKEGQVTVYFEHHGDEVITFVKDNGRGIPKEDINRIFERFYRVEKSRSKNKGGTGLGLAIVKHVLEAHNSQVQVDSTVGLGSVFSFKLPSGEDKLPPLPDEE